LSVRKSSVAICSSVSLSRRASSPFSAARIDRLERDREMRLLARLQLQGQLAGAGERAFAVVAELPLCFVADALGARIDRPPLAGAGGEVRDPDRAAAAVHGGRQIRGRQINRAAVRTELEPRPDGDGHPFPSAPRNDRCVAPAQHRDPPLGRRVSPDGQATLAAKFLESRNSVVEAVEDHLPTLRQRRDQHAMVPPRRRPIDCAMRISAQPVGDDPLVNGWNHG